MPTLSTTPIRGGTAAASAAMWPVPRAENSSTRWRVSASARRAVQGRPSSLLNDSGGATVGPSGASTAASRSFVEVLPELPVTPTTVSPGSSPTTCAGQPGEGGEHGGAGAVGVGLAEVGARDARDRGHDHRGPVDLARGEHGRRRPRSTAAAAKSCPSTRSPGNARNSPPGRMARESNSTAVTTSVPRAPCSRPFVTAAISDSDSGITVHIRSCEGRSSTGGPEHAGDHPSDSSGELDRVVERMPHAGHLLPGLVPLARDDDGVAGPGRVDRRDDRRAPVADLVQLTVAGLVEGARPAWRRGCRPGARSAGCRR